MHVRIDRDGRTVTGDVPEDADPAAVVSGALPDLLAAVHAGEVLPSLRVDGDEAAAGRALQRSSTPGRVGRRSELQDRDRPLGRLHR